MGIIWSDGGDQAVKTNMSWGGRADDDDVDAATCIGIALGYSVYT